MKSRCTPWAAVALVALSLAGCGGAATPAAPASAAPVTIEHKFGSTVVPAKPARVVTVGWNDQDFALALGVVPVATREWFTEYPAYPWVKAALGGQKLATFGGDLNYETIAAARPDLIIAIYETVDRTMYDKLSQIAPTVVQSAAYKDEQTPWDVQALTTGTALGRKAEAQALVDKVNARLAAVKKEHPEFAGQTLVVDYGPEQGQHWLIGAHDPRRALFDALGFAAQDTADEISEERLDLIDRDVLVVLGVSKADMLKSRTFAALGVVRADRTLYSQFSTPLAGALSYSGPEALLYALDILVPQLANALDGNAATPVADLSTAA